MAEDWEEAQRAQSAGASKSCVILCGGILEGMLLDVTLQNNEEACRAYQELKLGSHHAEPERWNLAELVEVAKRLEILHSGTAHLSHGLREYRNLIHPARQVRSQIKITENEASIALGVIRTSINELSRSPKNSERIVRKEGSSCER